MTFQKQILKSITTTNNEKQSSPDVTIENPLDDNIFVNGIELILSPEFSKKGKVVILINEVSVFDENDSEGFLGYSKFPIPLGKELRKSNDIQIFAWNGTDTNLIDVKINMSLSKELQPFNSQAVPLGKDVFNQVVSELESIIAFDNYSDETVTGLIKLAGYKSMIIIIVTAQNEAIVTSSDFGNSGNAVDADLVTKTNNLSISATHTIVVDFGVIASRPVGAKVGWNAGASDAQSNIVLATSDDNISYTDKDSHAVSGAPASSATLNATSHSFRYAKLTFTHGASTNRNHFVNEVFDSDIIGGAGAYSLQVKDITGTWLTLVSATALGTITSGAEITKQVGTVSTDESTNKLNISLPSTQTDFRVRLVVVGNFKTGFSIIKVS